MPLLFGYGSLVHPASLSRGLGRTVDARLLRPGRLSSHARVWGIAERIRVEGRELEARFLDLVSDPACHANGALVEVTVAELERLRVREKSYELVDVSASCPAGDRVWTFRSPPGATFRGTVVMASYVRLVEEAFSALGVGELETFRATTRPCPVPLLEGRYEFVDPAQNALTTRADEAA